jgi:hypothetical protein
MLIKLNLISYSFFLPFASQLIDLIYNDPSNRKITRTLFQATNKHSEMIFYTIRNKINFPLIIFTRTANKLNLLFQNPTRNVIKIYKSFFQNTYNTNCRLIHAILDSNHCQDFSSHQCSPQIRKLMKTSIMAKTEAIFTKSPKTFDSFFKGTNHFWTWTRIIHLQKLILQISLK